MAKIDFDTKNIGKQIHDDGEFDLPANLHSGVGQDLGLPSRFGINKSEDPIVIFDRFPGWTDGGPTRRKPPHGIHQHAQRAKGQHG